MKKRRNSKKCLDFGYYILFARACYLRFNIYMWKKVIDSILAILSNPLGNYSEFSIHYRGDCGKKELDLLIATSNKLIVMLFKMRLIYSSRYQKCRRAFLKFPYFRSYFKYQYLGVYTSGECVHVYARNIESDLLAEGARGGGTGVKEEERTSFASPAHP